MPQAMNDFFAALKHAEQIAPCRHAMVVAVTDDYGKVWEFGGAPYSCYTAVRKYIMAVETGLYVDVSIGKLQGGKYGQSDESCCAATVALGALQVAHSAGVLDDEGDP